jgi:hypothetical protein
VPVMAGSWSCGVDESHPATLELVLAAQFAALVTVDQNREFKQNVGAANLVTRVGIEPTTL